MYVDIPGERNKDKREKEGKRRDCIILTVLQGLPSQLQEWDKTAIPSPSKPLHPRLILSIPISPFISSQLHLPSSSSLRSCPLCLRFTRNPLPFFIPCNSHSCSLSSPSLFCYSIKGIKIVILAFLRVSLHSVEAAFMSSCCGS